jgi:ABC-type glycerol-3-phosphate transport system substrate-binding protein
VKEEATPAGPTALRIWLPPQFDPGGGSLAGNLLQERLDAFSERRENVRIEVRIKALDGPGGLYEALAATTAAAQLAMPDLVVLPHWLIQAAATKGLLRPMTELTSALDDPDWYDFARQSASLENNLFGLPFAGDVLIQVYRGGPDVQPALDWTAALALKTPFGFPAADPQALFGLALYEAAGGKLLDEEDRLTLQVEPLGKALEFFKAAAAVEVTPFWLTQYQADAQVWAAFQEGRTSNLAGWLSDYRAADLDGVRFDHIPTPDGKPFGLARGWAWTLTSPDAERREIAVELAEFLTESSFLARWSQAAGLLPARPSALAEWRLGKDAARLEPIAQAASLVPPSDSLKVMGPALSEAIAQVLKGQLEPQAAAQAAANQVSPP